MSAEQTVVEIHAWLRELYQLHGLEPGSPLTVSPIARSVAAVSQTIADVAGTVTVTRN